MSPIVQGFGAFTGCQLGEETGGWGVAASTFYDMPIVGETLVSVFDFAPTNPEFGGTGAETVVTSTSRRVEGDIRFHARLDARWFHIMLGHIMGTEDLRNEEDISGATTAAAADVSTHWYLPSNQGRSLTFRMWKGGNTSGGFWSEFTGCVVSQARVEWVPDGLMLWTVSFQGKTEALTSISGNLSDPAGSIVTDPRWGTTGAAEMLLGATPAASNYRGFSLVINRNVASVPSFANDIDVANQPTPQQKRRTTVDVTGFLEQDFLASGKPYKEFVDRLASTGRIKLRDAAATDDGGFYSIDFDFPNTVWLTGDAAIKEASSNPTAMQFQALKGTFSAPTTPTSGQNDFRIGVEVKESDEPATTPNHFTADQVSGYGVAHLTDDA